MKALRAPSLVSTPSLTRTQLSKPISTLNKPYSPLTITTLTHFKKPKFNNFTAVSSSVSTEQEPETRDEDDKFDWYAQWYAVMPVCDLDKKAPHGKKVMGLDIVVWWDKNENEWKVFDDMCPHRLAPLSEGRIDQWGRLQCVYHGWCFNGSGDCKLIPQAPLDGPPVHTFKKACVAVYPSTVQNGIIWFWPNTDPQYKDIVTKKKPPYIPELDDPSFTFQMFNRDIPYGYEILIENLMDPAHVPYAHYGLFRTPQSSVKVDREGGAPIDINIDQIHKNGFDANQPYGGSKFVSPCLHISYTDIPKPLDSKKALSQKQKQKQPIITESSSFDPLMGDYDNPINEGKQTPPKDFVCPITTHIFSDPVTLETGQTYERKAIQQWLERGNSTCPITRQKLHITQLPKTNYILKHLIASWQELNPSNSNQENEQLDIPSLTLTSPDNGSVNELKAAITKLCTSEVLKEAEAAVFTIERFWHDVTESSIGLELEIQDMLSQPPVINGFMEILFSSVNTRVLISTVFLLSELGSRNEDVISTLTRVESDVECVIALFQKGLFEAVVLIYLLKPSVPILVQVELVDSLLSVVNKNENEFFKMCVKPKTAAVLLLGQIVSSGDDVAVFEVVRRVISGKVIECIISSLESEWTEERITAVRLLLKCIQEDGKCRNIIADKAELAPLLEVLVGANDEDRFEIVQFLSELVKLNRRTFNNQILHIIKDEGTFSTMHTLLAYLQTAETEQLPVVAGLLLQLDLLTEPRKMSIYREEAIDTLIACIKNSDSPSAQIAAAETILALQGRFSSFGKPLTRAYLLKNVGLDNSYRSTMRKEQLSAISGEIQETMEEEKAAEEWERKAAFVLASHEFGLIFEGLSEGLKSNYAEIYSACFVCATWLVHMLTLLPDTGIKGAARICLLNRFVSIFKSAKDTEDKALSMLALRSFIQDPDGQKDISPHMKDIIKGLKEFKKSSKVAFEMLKVLSEGSESSADLWNHKELAQQDCSINGEVSSIVCYKDKIFTGHSDGMIKVWTGRGSVLHLLQEIKEHSKAVTSLTVLQSGDTLYSGSHDKTVRGWSVNKEMIQCEQVYDVKDHVNNLLVANSISCFIPQGAGIKIHSWSGTSKLLNPSKYVKCMALLHGRLYTGCHDNSIQEIDLATGTLSSIQSGSRKLLGKSTPVNALKVHDGLIYSASSSIEGTALKVWNAANYTLTHSVSLASEVRTMVISSDIIYMGCKGGIVEVWCKKKLSRKEVLHIGTNCKVTCMALDNNEDYLVVGTSDGKVQAWGVS